MKPFYKKISQDNIFLNYSICSSYVMCVWTVFPNQFDFDNIENTVVNWKSLKFFFNLTDYKPNC